MRSAGASKGGRGPGPPIEKLPPPGRLRGKAYYLYACPVGTVVFNANNHEAN